MHDDGLQLVSEEMRQTRVEFYAEHGIGWVARPKHDDSEGGFKRRGRFKKASNMNYGLALSLKMEEHIKKLELDRAEKTQRGEELPDDDGELEEKALELAIEETFEETGRKYRPWARNARSLRVGQVILIVDSDTIVPEVLHSRLVHYLRMLNDRSQDCFRDAVRELAECPEVAIIQHESGKYALTHISRQV